MAEHLPLSVERATEMIADFELTAERVAELQRFADAPVGTGDQVRTIWYRIASHTATSEEPVIAELE